MRGINEVRREVSLEGGPRCPQPEQDRGEGTRDRGQSVVEHRHLDEEASRPLRVAHRQLERDIGAKRGSSHHRRGQLEVVEQRHHLAGKERHRVEPQVLGPVRAPVAEQVDADHPVAGRGQFRPQPLEHAPVHQQPVDEDEHALALPVGVV